MAGLAAALASSGLVALSAGTAQAAAIEVDGVQFRWGINQEANSAGFAPGSFNFLSAGILGNPGAGSQILTPASQGALWSNGAAADWKATDGYVTIEKKQADGSYAPTTWDGRNTTPEGATVQGNSHSAHQVVIDEGTGTIDVEANDAEITWDGDFTVVLYSGLTYFSVSDPQLSVDNGTGSVTATLSGYGSRQDDMSKWEPLPSTEVTLANLKNVDVTAAGFSGDVEYVDVAYNAPEGAPAQVEKTGSNASYWGSFPQDFVDFQQLSGGSSYWYSSGGAADAKKVPYPIEVNVPTSSAPSVTATPTENLANGQTVVRVTGTGFKPSLSVPPLQPAGLSSGGVYVALGRFAKVWKPSEGASGSPSPRPAIKQHWALPTSSDRTLAGGSAAGAIELSPSGKFTTEFTVDKDQIDALTTQPEGNLGIYTYTRKSDLPSFETYTPITFKPTVSLSTSTAPVVGQTEITVTGRDFKPTLSTPPANPAGLTSGGVYVALGRFASDWKPSQNVPASPNPRPNIEQYWALPTEADRALVGGAQRGAVAMDAQGNFTVTFTVDKSTVDALEDHPDGKFGVYTFTRKNDLPSFETFSEITFAKLATTVAPSAAASTTFGKSVVSTVTVKDSDADRVPTGTVSAKIGSRTIASAKVDASGKSKLTLPRDTKPGSNSITYVYSGDNTFASSTSARSLRVNKDSVSISDKVTKKPTTKKSGKIKVTVKAKSSSTKPSGKVTVYFKKKGQKTVKTSTGTLKSGTKTLSVKKLKKKGTWTIYVKYSAGTGYKSVSSKKVGTVKVTK
jgi:hypothetical protein